jgi:APA family basic amino acid/polyamine antiporter
VVALLTGLSYGELAARYPVSAGEAVYTQKAFGRRWLSTLVGGLIALAGLVSAATMLRGLVGYLQLFVDLPPSLVIVVGAALFTFVAIRGIGESARVAAALTLIEAGGLIWIVVVAAPALPGWAAIPVSQLLPLHWSAWAGVFAGAFLAFFAYIGFEDMVNIAEEVEQPERNLPRGIILAFVISTILYLLVAAVSLVVIAPNALSASEAPLALVYETASGRSPGLIGIIGVIAVCNGALIQIIMASRIFYGMSVNGWLPGFLARVSPVTRTPVVATLAAGGIVVLLSLLLPILSLAKATSFIVLTVFVLVNVSLLAIKRRYPLPDGIRPVPIWLPVLAALACMTVMTAALLGNG